jgi:hypothetical protein
MILPRKWIIGRPGFLIPVFFLSCCQVLAQVYQQDARTMALGQCYASSSGDASAGLNQAGLGQSGESSCALHHLRPFITSDLDIISLSAQLSLKRGGPGLVLSTMGITGMRQTSTWISYGLRLHPRIRAGAGLHLRFTSIPEDAIFHPEAGFAMGLQFRVSEELILGAHMNHPAAWTDTRPGNRGDLMMISTGLSYTFFKTARFHTELHITAGAAIQWCNGLEIEIAESIKLYLGMNNQPWSLSGGLSFEYRSWGIILAATSCMDTGITPSSSLSHAW